MRYNIFNQIHKALRALLYDTAAMIQQTDFADAAEAEQALTRLQQVIAAFEVHAFVEDNFILPAVQKPEPALKTLFNQEHDEDHALAQRLAIMIKAFSHTVSATEKTKAGMAIQIAFTEFVVFNLEHMAREEDVLNAALWRHYNDAQLMNLNKIIIGNVPPEALSLASRWMIKSLNNPEIITWLKQVRSTAPEPAFRGLFNMAASELAPARWQLIQEVLMEGVMVAG
jgi:hypothetical protein